MSSRSQPSQKSIHWEQNRAGKKTGCGEPKKTVLELITALKQCALEADLDKGKHLHLKAFQSGCHANKHVSTALITMYSSCKSIHLAQAVFNSLILLDVTSWNSLILGYVENGEYFTALDLFKNLDCEPNSVTFIAALKACGGMAAKDQLDRVFCLVKGMELHKLVSDSYKDVAVGNALVDMYCRCKSMKHARATFEALPSRTIVSWNTLIMRFAESGEKLAALELFLCMDCEPDSVSCIVAFKILSELAVNGRMEREFCLENGIGIHVRAMELGLHAEIIVANTLIDMYGKLKCMVHAQAVFDSMVTRCSVTWTSLMHGYVINGKGYTALELYMCMDCKPSSCTYTGAANACGDMVSGGAFNECFCLELGMVVHKDSAKGSMDVFVGSNLVELYCKCGSMRHARALFNSMVFRDVVSWNNLMLGLVENGESLIALELFEFMDCAPNSISFFAALKACWELASSLKFDKSFCLMKGTHIHRKIKLFSELEDDMFVRSNLIAMYSKCGSMTHAQAVFDATIHKDVVTWNILMFGYIENDYNLVAINIFTRMHCQPNCASYIAALKACGNIAALDTGQRIHSQICSIGLEQEPVIATCLVNFYGKCGIMYAAEHVFNKMPLRDVVSWNALMSGYSSLGEAQPLFRAVRKMGDAGLQPNNITYLLILKACNHVGLVEEGQDSFQSMLRYGIQPTMEHYSCLGDICNRAAST